MDKNQMNSHKRPCSKPFVTVLTIKKNIFMDKNQMNYRKRRLLKPYFTPLTRIT